VEGWSGNKQRLRRQGGLKRRAATVAKSIRQMQANTTPTAMLVLKPKGRASISTRKGKTFRIKFLQYRSEDSGYGEACPPGQTVRQSLLQNMVWVIDGRRNDFDATNFRLGLGSRVDRPDQPTIFPFEWYGRGKLFDTWQVAMMPVFIDFGIEFSDPVAWRLVLYDQQKKARRCGAYPEATVG
jgi:hypothetical protein